jgi:four helix bundle protein
VPGFARHSGCRLGMPARCNVWVVCNRLAMQRLDAYQVARELAKRVHEAKVRDTELRDQATRAAKSCFLTLCEGLPNEGVAMRRKYFTESNNSLHEVVGAIDLAHAIGAVDEPIANEVQELVVRLKRMLRALLR